MDNQSQFKTAKETANAFAEYFMEAIKKKGGAFHCALSGGSTPKLMFDILSEKYPDSPLWEQVHLYWGDERCVSPDHEESNYKMTKEHLLDNIRIPTDNIHRVRGEDDPLTEANRYAHELTTFIPVDDEVPVFDLIILGMGADGHTASIFPHEMNLLTSGQICEVAVHPESGQKRITLTGPVINQAKEVVFLVTGDSKKEKVYEIFSESGVYESYPASHIKPKNGILKWYIDNAAATLL